MCEIGEKSGRNFVPYVGCVSCGQTDWVGLLVPQ